MDSTTAENLSGSVEVGTATSCSEVEVAQSGIVSMTESSIIMSVLSETAGAVGTGLR